MKSWAIYIAIAGGIYLFSNSFDADRNADGAIISEGQIDAFNIHVGDCFNDAASTGDEYYELSNVAGVPCTQPHDNEVYAVFDVSVESFPGEEAMSELAFDSCLKRFELFVGTDYQSSSLDIMTLYPTSASWVRDDREVICAVYDMNLAKLEGSVAGLAL
jgi:hypothetical protein